MTDRIPTELLENGAIRYGIYDASGNLLRYEYIKPEDNPSAEGTPLNKGNLLSDETEIAIWGSAANRTVNEALAKLQTGADTIWASVTGEDGLQSKIARIEVGGYVGSGTYGSTHPNSLTFNFVPKFIIIQNSSGGYYARLFWGSASVSAYGGGTTATWTITYADKTMSWYSNSALNQFNYTDTNYNYIVIG